MAMIIGIDTGGTCTDAVVLDRSTGEVLTKAKAFTTADDLSAGIRTCLSRLDPVPLQQVSEIHLSTTLATNAVLENRFPGIGLLMIGHSPDLPYPVSAVRQIRCTETITRAELQERLDQVDASFWYGLSEVMVSVTDDLPPHLEQDAAQMLQPKGLSLLCARQLCQAPDCYSRTVTALLEAGLRPLIRDLLSCTHQVFVDMGIHAPMYIMCGNGELISRTTAETTPTMTLLSGPAASVAGSLFMTDLDQYLLVDMGGTSADITRMIHRRLDILPDTCLREYPISARSLNIQSFSIGGDSHIHFDSSGELQVGPQRVIPLCVAGTRWPHLEEELRTHHRPQGYEMFTVYDTDCFCIGSNRVISDLRNDERRIVEYLRQAPHSLFHLSEKFHIDADSMHLEHLVKKGQLRRISFTPTDMLHITGKYVTWNRDIAVLGGEILAGCGRMELEDFTDLCARKITDRLVFSCMQSISNFEEQTFDFEKDPAAQYVISRYLQQDDPYLQVDFRITKPIVAVGAPAGSWMQDVARRLGAPLILPAHFDVANAIGAAAAQYLTKSEVL